MPPSLPEPCLCLVTDRKVVDEGTLIERVSEAVAGGVNMVQLREKDLPGQQLLNLALDIKQEIKGRAMLIVNERADVAVAAGADGLQLGEQALPLAAARQIVGPQALIGRSIHSPEGAIKAQAEGADYLVVGPIYATGSHPQTVPAGPQLLKQVAQLPEIRSVSLPLIGIGGITAENLGEVILAGASGVAVITSILASPDPGQQARKLRLATLDVWPGNLPLSRQEAEGGPIRA